MLDSLETRDIVAAYEGRAAARRAVREVLFVPDSLPPISRVVVAHNGEVWLGHTVTSDKQLWTILDADGSSDFEVATPSSVRVEDVSGDWIVGVRADNQGRNQIVRLRFR